MDNSSYKKFGGMMLASFVIMYSVMFLNVASTEHIYLSLTRLYMALLMVAPMALLKLIFMGNMYKNKKWNGWIASLSLVVFIAALAMLRNQTFISDAQYMKAMIPHHSSAILTSSHASLKNEKVRALAKGIIEAQEREIALMKEYLEQAE
ncbi:MAG: DUF305 domain-containing protein [Bacteroidetes bacterium]|nr:DUF305 domain-containing protein [Bacteroidota bacterium]